MFYVFSGNFVTVLLLEQPDINANIMIIGNSFFNIRIPHFLLVLLFLFNFYIKQGKVK